MTEVARAGGAGVVSMIWAQARGGVIGAGGALPWHLPEDLALFRRRTTGSTVVMGRRTWESLPARFRPLPERLNVVLTTDETWSADGACPARSVRQVLDEHGSLWVIGGGAVYTAFLPHADRLVVTDVDAGVDGDTWAPALDAGWTRTARTPETGWSVSESAGLRFAVSEYERVAVGGTGPRGAAR